MLDKYYQQLIHFSLINSPALLGVGRLVCLSEEKVMSALFFYICVPVVRV